MSKSKFKTLRHIETVRNYLNTVIKELLNRQQNHDQTKLQTPEVEVFEKFTPKLKGVKYGSPEYRNMLKGMAPAIEHHNKHNRHHPEHFIYHECNGCFKRFKAEPETCCDVCGYSQFQKRPDISGMNLIDLIEMICDWRASSLRHGEGDIYDSIAIGRKRFEYSDELAEIFKNTADFLSGELTPHHAEES